MTALIIQLNQAIVGFDTPKIRDLLQAEIDLNEINEEGKTFLSLASKLGNLEAAELLLMAGASKDFGGFETPLYHAISWNHIHVAETLVHAGANVNLANDERRTVLMRAAQLGHFEAVKLLVAAGAEIGVVDKDGNTALLEAAGAGHKEITEYLASLYSSDEDKDYVSYALELVESEISHKVNFG